MSRRELLLLGLAFLASGASALVYQVSWQRILALHTGVGIVSISLIVGAFLLGLGLGSHAGGVLSARLGPRQALQWFALVELAVACFGAASPYVFYDWLYLRAAWLYRSLWVAAPLHFLSLLVPTTLMGMSLPFLVRAAVRNVSGAGRVIGFLYGINVVGASLGAVATPWLLIRFFGIRGAVSAAAASNLLAMSLALLLLRRFAPDVPGSAAPLPSPHPPPPAGRHPFVLWMGLYALSGFCALSLEIVWFRIVDLGAKTMSFSFGTVLALFLAGNAAGSLIGSRLVPRIERPLRIFLGCQTGLLLYSGLAIVLLVRLPADTPHFEWFYGYWSQAGAFDIGRNPLSLPALKLYGWFPAFLFGLPTIAMGFSFPVLQRAVHVDVVESGRRVGLLQASNIAGNVAGSLLTGLVLLGLVGTTGTLRILCFLGLLFVAVGVAFERLRASMALAAASLLALVLALPDGEALWRRLHGADGFALVSEDATGVAAIVPEGDARFRVFVNGKSHSWIPFGGVHTRLGALPALIHDEPAEVAIIGLGSGDSAWAAALRRETRSVTVFEISGQQPELLWRLSRDERVDAGIRRSVAAFLEDPRIEVKIGDGRQALQHGERRYDLIQADALATEMALSGSLYSVEFFDLCRRRLKPGGIMCTWAPTPRVRRSFREAFPYVLEIDDGTILVGSNDFIRIERRRWRDRVLSPPVVDYLRSPGVARRVLLSLRTVRKPPEALEEAELNRDLFPRDEFRTP